MSQADGSLPTPAAVRQEMRTLKPLLDRLEAALTAVARLNGSDSVSEKYDALAALSEAHADATEALRESGVTLELPYQRVLTASYTAMFGPED